MHGDCDEETAYGQGKVRKDNKERQRTEDVKPKKKGNKPKK